MLPTSSPTDFTHPIQLPATDEVRREWQLLNRAWWEQHPMRYDAWGRVQHKPFTEPFYCEIDARFYACLAEMLPWRDTPFDALVDFDALGSKDVLEIGVGCGTHAELLSRRARQFTGIDLTDYAVACTTNRFALRHLDGRILRMDAEQMAFEDEQFDFVWSWGAVHHSADTSRILREVHRVLRPGGRVFMMVYHRSPWNTFVRGALYYGLLQGEFLRGKSVHRIIQDASDGAIARYYRRDEWKAALGDRFRLERMQVIGQKAQLVPFPPRIKASAMALVSDGLARFISNRPSVGYLLVSTFTKQ